MEFGDGTTAAWVKIILHPHQILGIPLEDQLLFQLYAATAIDLLWAIRNQIEHGGKGCDVQEFVRRVRRIALEHGDAWRKKLGPAKVLCWTPPPADSIKRNNDVAVRESFAELAAVARDCEGKVKLQWSSC